MRHTFDRRLPALDGLRAISITLVILAHVGTSGVGPNFNDILWRINPAATGVSIFFVISGYLITALLLAEHRSQGYKSIPGFYLRRTLRIVPVYLFFLSSMVVIAGFGTIELSWRDVWPCLLYVSNYVSTSWTVAHTWSLSIEEQFYLLWPLLLLKCSRKTAILAVAAFVVLSPAIRLLNAVCECWPSQIGSAFETQADAIAWGCMAVFLQNSMALSKRRRLFASPLAWFPSVVLLGGFIMIANVPHADLVRPTLLASGVAALILACVHQPKSSVSLILDLPALRGIGLLSYSIYLWQQPFFDSRYPLEPWIIAVGLIFSAMISFFLVERPFLRARKRLELALLGHRPLGNGTV